MVLQEAMVTYEKFLKAVIFNMNKGSDLSEYLTK